MEGYRVIIYINYLNRFSKLFFVVKMPNFKAVSIGCIYSYAVRLLETGWILGFACSSVNNNSISLAVEENSQRFLDICI